MQLLGLRSCETSYFKIIVNKNFNVYVYLKFSTKPSNPNLKVSKYKNSKNTELINDDFYKGSPTIPDRCFILTLMFKCPPFNFLERDTKK